MRTYESLVVVGSSGAGKTTLVNALRDPIYQDVVHIPKRYITRPERLGDDTIENQHISKQTFEECVRTKNIDPYWTRQLGRNRIEYYGFARADAAEERLLVYSANNALLMDQNQTVRRLLDNCLLVIVTNHTEEREKRLQTRSPDISSEERETRLKDPGPIACAYDLPHKIICTNGLTVEEGQATFINLIQDNCLLG